MANDFWIICDLDRAIANCDLCRILRRLATMNFGTFPFLYDLVRARVKSEKVAPPILAGIEISVVRLSTKQRRCYRTNDSTYAIVLSYRDAASCFGYATMIGCLGDDAIGNVPRIACLEIDVAPAICGILCFLIEGVDGWATGIRVARDAGTALVTGDRLDGLTALSGHVLEVALCGTFGQCVRRLEDEDLVGLTIYPGCLGPPFLVYGPQCGAYLSYERIDIGGCISFEDGGHYASGL